MASFKDSEGREWELRLTLRSASRVKEKTGVNINDALKVTKGDGVKETTLLIQQLIDDPHKLYSVVVCLLEPQFKSEGITEEQFGEALDDEDVVADIVEALNLAVIDFFPSDRRAALRRAFERLWSAGKKRSKVDVEAAIERVEKMDVEKLVDDAFSSFVGNSEGTSESIRESSPSGN